MNQNFCKICGGALIVVTLGQFVVCGYLVCRECGHPDLPAEKTFVTSSSGPASINLSATFTATTTPQDFNES